MEQESLTEKKMVHMDKILDLIMEHNREFEANGGKDTTTIGSGDEA